MGSGTPPWLHHVGPTMAARVWPKPSPRQLEDLRRPSASSRCFSFVSAALWWMDRSISPPWAPKGLYLCPWEPWGVLHLALHEIFLRREGNLVSIKLASSRFSRFAALSCWHHISHVRTPNNANSVSRCVPRNYLQLWYSFVSLETMIRSPKHTRKTICLISDLSAQLAFWVPYLLPPWPELGLPHVQIEGIIETHNFGNQTFDIRGRLSFRICTEISCCPGLWEYLSGWVNLVVKHPSPRSFTASCFGPWAIWNHVHHVSWLVPGFTIFSWSAWWTYLESLLFNVIFLRKQ
jgi:hypothetical protein